MISRHQA